MPNKSDTNCSEVDELRVTIARSILERGELIADGRFRLRNIKVVSESQFEAECLVNSVGGSEVLPVSVWKWDRSRILKTHYEIAAQHPYIDLGGRRFRCVYCKTADGQEFGDTRYGNRP